MIKKILLSLVAIIALVLIIAAFLPKDFSLTAETTINAPQIHVWNYVKSLTNQTHYSVRVMADPDVKLSYSGTDGTVGFRQARDSQVTNVGAGEQEITAMEEGQSYQVEIRFLRPMQWTNYAKTTLESLGSGQTKVTNTFRGKNPRPMNLISKLFLPQVRRDMQQTMDNLKKRLE